MGTSYFGILTPTEQRDRSIIASVQGRTNALELARRVSDPWFRSQALAYAARYARDEEACALIARRALDGADESDDEFERAAVRAWPINAMIQRNIGRGVIEEAIDEAVERCRAIENPNRRAYALMELTQATVVDQALWSRLQEVVFETAPQVSHWRGQRSIRDIALMTATLDSGVARQFAESLPECRFRRQALRRLEAGEIIEPWLFHWTAR